MAINNRLEKIIKTIDKLPAFPEVARRILEIAKDPDADANDMVKTIQYDQAVTTNCLRLCNSSYFGLREKVWSVNHAIVLLGTDSLIKIVLADCSRMSIYARAQEGYGMHPGELWRHSVGCALLSQMLLKKAGQKESHELFTAALLHDIGKLVIDSFIADDFEAIFSLMHEEGFGFVEAEKEFFGIDHAELGGMIAQNWNFPQSLIDAINNHHQGLSGKTEDVLSAFLKGSLDSGFSMPGCGNHHKRLRKGQGPGFGRNGKGKNRKKGELGKNSQAERENS